MVSVVSGVFLAAEYPCSEVWMTHIDVVTVTADLCTAGCRSALPGTDGKPRQSRRAPGVSPEEHL